MSTVLLKKQAYLVSPLGAENPLPDFGNVSYVHARVEWDDSLTGEDVRYMRYGRVSSILPYREQSGYERNPQPRMMDTVLLENKRVRAQFLPWMGGRLWSLCVDGRELLSVNPLVQPCNLALRGAWCSGGVEWNMGVRGHSVFTCETLFTELLELPDGTAGVRFYEFDRIRGTLFCIEGYLPEDSRFLFIQVRLKNPVGNGETPMYWWSNIAVPETPGTQVITSAPTGVLSFYNQGSYFMTRKPLPVFEGADLSYPTHISRSIDIFYDLPQGELPYITALNEAHRGLVQCSTSRLLGRKLFVWGMGAGGRHWQEFLSDGKTRYIEIQAGLARTQQDHLPMPEGAEWSWLEAYGELNCPLDGCSWSEAGRRCADALRRQITLEELEAEHGNRGAQIARARGSLAVQGSGWGALENRRRAQAGLPPLDDICVFPEESLTEAQTPWMTLLEEHAFPSQAPQQPPAQPNKGAYWRALLENLAFKNASAWYQLGVLRYIDGDAAAARAAMEQSLLEEDNPWAHRCLARMAQLANDQQACLSHYQRVISAGLPCHEPAQEYVAALLSFGMVSEALQTLESLPQAWQEKPRFLYLRADALIEQGRYDEAKAILLKPLIIPDMREGELSLASLWSKLHCRQYALTAEEARRRYPLPYALDFRMHETD